MLIAVLQLLMHSRAESKQCRCHLVKHVAEACALPARLRFASTFRSTKHSTTQNKTLYETLGYGTLMYGKGGNKGKPREIGGGGVGGGQRGKW